MPVSFEQYRNMPPKKARRDIEQIIRELTSLIHEKEMSISWHKDTRQQYKEFLVSLSKRRPKQADNEQDK